MRGQCDFQPLVLSFGVLQDWGQRAHIIKKVLRVKVQVQHKKNWITEKQFNSIKLVKEKNTLISWKCLTYKKIHKFVLLVVFHHIVVSCTIFTKIFYWCFYCDLCFKEFLTTVMEETQKSHLLSHSKTLEICCFPPHLDLCTMPVKTRTQCFPPSDQTCGDIPEEEEEQPSSLHESL